MKITKYTYGYASYCHFVLCQINAKTTISCCLNSNFPLSEFDEVIHVRTCDDASHRATILFIALENNESTIP